MRTLAIFLAALIILFPKPTVATVTDESAGWEKAGFPLFLGNIALSAVNGVFLARGKHNHGPSVVGIALGGASLLLTAGVALADIDELGKSDALVFLGTSGLVSLVLGILAFGPAEERVSIVLPCDVRIEPTIGRVGVAARIGF